MVEPGGYFALDDSDIEALYQLLLAAEIVVCPRLFADYCWPAAGCRANPPGDALATCWSCPTARYSSPKTWPAPFIASAISPKGPAKPILGPMIATRHRNKNLISEILHNRPDRKAYAKVVIDSYHSTGKIVGVYAKKQFFINYQKLKQAVDLKIAHRALPYFYSP